MTPTEQYVEVLTHLQPAELSLLRGHAGQGLDQSVDGFDLFAGLWWPLRAANKRAPRRGVAWLIAKLYALRPIAHSPGETLARQLPRCSPIGCERFENRFDQMLSLPIQKIEPALRWALGLIAAARLGVDWARLTDELSRWEQQTTRARWAAEFLATTQEEQNVD